MQKGKRGETYPRLYLRPHFHPLLHHPREVGDHNEPLILLWRSGSHGSESERRRGKTNRNGGEWTSGTE